jgi:transcription-repair coupling factor (superfamily II helicase)
VELLPEARIAVAHGQMPERELEHVMRDFVAQRHNVLLCSTIIETGIDVPSANTIVISRADKFGLAQLHQLRGRVGRSHHQAYAYLLVPDVQGLTKQAAMRLQAIQDMEELGSGFYLAMHDLEIRGAGEVLGENQSGNMMEVGFQLYNDMLSEAVRSLKAGHEPDLLSPLSATTEINLHAPALLPDAYCGDVHTRLNLYKRLATAEKPEQIDTLLEEITDRFGKLPSQGQTLFDTHRLRVLAKPYGVLKIDAGPKLMNVTFRPNPPIDARASSSWCRRTARSSWPATTSCASTARSHRRPTARTTCATCCARWATPQGPVMTAREVQPGLFVRGFHAAAAPGRLQAGGLRHGLHADQHRVHR